MEFLIGRTLANNITNLQVEPVVRDVDRARGPRLGGARRDGARRRAGQRRAGPAGRLLPRLDGDARRSRRSVTACGTSTACSARRSTTAGRSSTPTTGCAVPTPGRSSGPPRGRGGPAQLRLPVAGRAGSRSSRTCRRPCVGIPYDRPVVGYGGRTINTLRLWGAATHRGLQLPGVQPRRLLRRRPREGRRRGADPGPLPRRLDAPRQGPAVRPGVFPGRLLAGRHRGAVPPPRQRLAGAARQGRHPAQRHPPVAGRRRADAHPARPGPARLGRSVGPDRPDPGLHQSHADARGPGDLAGHPLRDRLAPAPRDHLRDQPPLPRRRPRALSRRRRTASRASA